MIDIEIRPAHGVVPGRLVAEGHAGPAPDLVCCAAGAMIGCLKANLEICFGVSCKSESREGYGKIIWGRQRRAKQGALDRANKCAGYAYNGLKALEKEHPGALRVRWQPAAPTEGNL